MFQNTGPMMYGKQFFDWRNNKTINQKQKCKQFFCFILFRLLDNNVKIKRKITNVILCILV